MTLTKVMIWVDLQTAGNLNKIKLYRWQHDEPPLSCHIALNAAPV
jgi:hypothetical protein